ncbi:hypothetical protein FACS189491_01280 [Spirochaetia bacterium]|nr:hypothetical protein FACS189491_01280 [Spirochaetia bacterium]
MALVKGKGTIIIECPQKIPCNPCVDACRFGAIQKRDLNSCPTTVEGICTGCKQCVAACPGQAIFFLVPDFDEGYSAITFPYEYLPLPSVGQAVTAVDADGVVLCDAEVLRVDCPKIYNKTNLITLRVRQPLGARTRGMKRPGCNDKGENRDG